MVSKEILIQYSDLQEEVKEVRERIDKTEKQIAKIEDEGNVVDSVCGGDGGIQHFKIEGFPYPRSTAERKRFYTLGKLRLQALKWSLWRL